MWVEKLKSGALRLCDRVEIDGKVRRVVVPLEKDTPQARRRALDAMQAKIRAFGHLDAKTLLFDAVEGYLKKKKYRESTRKVNASAIWACADMLGNIPLSQLSAARIRRVFMESGKPAEYCNRKMSFLASFLRWCFEYEYLEEDIAARLRPLPAEKVPKDPEGLYLEPDELRRVLDQLQGTYFYFAKFLVLTGCRIGEAAALRLDDIKETYINVSRSYSALSYETTAPKNSHSNREVYIQPELAEFLAEYLKFRKIFMMAHGIRTDLLFFNRNGTTFSEAVFRRKLAKLVCSKHVHPHIFRHTHTALLAEQGVTLDAIARRLGHADSTITKSVYYHVTKKQKQKDEAALAAVRIL